MNQALKQFQVIMFAISILIIWAILNQAGISMSDLVMLITH